MKPKYPLSSLGSSKNQKSVMLSTTFCNMSTSHSRSINLIDDSLNSSIDCKTKKFDEKQETKRKYIQTENNPIKANIIEKIKSRSFNFFPKKEEAYFASKKIKNITKIIDCNIESCIRDSSKEERSEKVKKDLNSETKAEISKLKEANIDLMKENGILKRKIALFEEKERRYLREIEEKNLKIEEMVKSQMKNELASKKITSFSISCESPLGLFSKDKLASKYNFPMPKRENTRRIY